MAAAMARGGDEAKRALILAHPDLAGKLALSKRLTSESTQEQAGAGLDRLSAEELDRFTELNAAYRARFGFPFIMAVKGRTKAEIIAAFELRLGNDARTEFATALAQIDHIAALRIAEALS
jgi:OHCU decarboxylase